MLAGMRDELKTPPTVAVATAYINPGGVGLLLGELDKVPARAACCWARIPSPDPERKIITEGSPTGTERAGRRAVPPRGVVGRRAGLDGLHRRGQARWRSGSSPGFSPRTRLESGEWRCAGSPRASCMARRLIGEHEKYPAVIAGSSNFTYAGSDAQPRAQPRLPSRESRLCRPGSGVVRGDCGCTPTRTPWRSLYAAQWELHTPWAVFLRMLLELYRATEDDDEQPAHRA